MMNIILVEDDPDHRTILKSRLSELFHSCIVQEFPDAGSCLQFIDVHKKVPDVIISDLSLNNTMDGYDLYKELQRRKIPSQFILISSNFGELSKKKDNLKGSDCYFLKDHFFKGSVDVLRESIRQKRSQI